MARKKNKNNNGNGRRLATQQSKKNNYWRWPMAGKVTERFDNVSVLCKANVYFDGKVISHTLLFPDGTKKTVGLIYPGSFTFNTDAPERMEIIAGRCRVRQAGDDHWTPYTAGTFFLVPGKSSFEIAVEEGFTEYVCSFE
jgi:purine/pyrimidine-nucleoside phosphorylase